MLVLPLALYEIPYIFTIFLRKYIQYIRSWHNNFEFQRIILICNDKLQEQEERDNIVLA